MSPSATGPTAAAARRIGPQQVPRHLPRMQKQILVATALTLQCKVLYDGVMLTQNIHSQRHTLRPGLKFRPQGRLRSFVTAIRGIAVLLRTQPNARIHAVAAIVVIAAGVWCSLSSFEWSAVALAFSTVWTAEALNTALEFLSDRISPDYSPLIRNAKDVAAAGVLFACVVAAAIGLLIFVPRLLK